jgi:anti-sigma B factor antagonist
VIFDLAVTEHGDGVVVISIIGELDMSTAPRLREELIRVAAAMETPRVVLDLAGVDLLDPTGLGVIFDGVKRTRSRGGDLALACAEPQVIHDLEIMRVIEILPVFESVDEAVQSFSG